MSILTLSMILPVQSNARQSKSGHVDWNSLKIKKIFIPIEICKLAFNKYLMLDQTQTDGSSKWRLRILNFVKNVFPIYWKTDLIGIVCFKQTND